MKIMKMNKSVKYVLILLVLSYFFLMFGNNIISLTNPDEVFYSQIAKEMIKHKSWMTEYLFDQPQFEKPVFLYWLLRIAFFFLGTTAFAARFFPAVFAIIGVLAVYYLGVLGFRQRKKAFISALILMSSGLYIGLARTVFTDMVFTVLTLLSILSFYWGYSHHSKKGVSIILFYIFSALAVLTKGPLGFFIPASVLLVFLFFRKDLRYLRCRQIFWGALLFIAISFPWYIFMVKKYGTSFTQEFFYNSHIRRIFEAEHVENDTWYFYPMSIFGCMFPWSLFVAVSLYSLFKKIKEAKPVYLFLACWIAVNFLIFQPAHSKLTSYIFPMFPALALVAGDFIYQGCSSAKKNRLFFNLLWINCFILILFPIGLGVSMVKFSKYVTSEIPMYVLIFFLSMFILCIINFVLRRGLFKAIYSVSFLLPLFLFVVPFVRNDMEPYVSSKYACEYLLANYNINHKIIASKFFARGVRYYTEKDVAVINTPERNFFSPLPIQFITSDEELIAFLRKQPVTYCIVRKSNTEDIKRIGGEEFKVRLLKIIGNAYILKVESNINK